MPSVEERLKTLEQNLAGVDLGALYDQLQANRRELAASRSARSTGNVLGGMIATQIGPAWAPIGPYRQDLDPGFPLSFTLRLPTYLLRIKTATLVLKPGPVRSSVTVADASGELTSEDGGGITSGASSATSSGASSSSSSAASSTSSSGASTSSTTAGGSAHSHTLTGFSTDSGGGSTTGTGAHQHAFSGIGGFTDASNSNIYVSTQAHTHFVSGVGNTGIESLPPTLVANYNHSHSAGSFAGVTSTEFAGGHTHSTPNHQHSITGQTAQSESSHIHGMAHTHNIDHTHQIAHTHDISHTHELEAHSHVIPSHGHTLTLGIQESGAAAGMHLYIDDIDRTTDLGGPWNAEVEVDVLQYLVNARQEPVAGAHSITVTSTAVGSVEVTGDLYCILKAITP